MTMSPGQVFSGLLDNVPLYGFCTAIRQVKPLYQKFLGTEFFALLQDTATGFSVFTPNQKESLSFTTGQWPSQLTPWWGKPHSCSSLAIWSTPGLVCDLQPLPICSFVVDLTLERDWEEKSVRNMLSEGCLLKILLSAVIFKHSLERLYTVGFPQSTFVSPVLCAK